VKDIEAAIFSYRVVGQRLHVILLRDVRRETPFYRLRVSDHQLERLVGLKDLGRRAFGLLDLWTGLGPDDSPPLLCECL
jgi:hypothetical protein